MATMPIELIFPPENIPNLADARGKHWQDFIENSCDWIHSKNEQIALTLVLARMNNCATCTTNSYRAMQGCESCARQTLKRFRGPDQELIIMYQNALKEVTGYLRI